MKVSIIICSCNRSASLRKTLESLRGLDVPPSWLLEVLVVDNASTDDTAEVVKEASLKSPSLRYVHEPQKGKCHALNTGLSLAAGEFILFTDDDVLPRANWLTAMVEPMLNGQCDAVNGNLELAPHLLRSWQTPVHLMWLAASLNAESRDWSRELVGANMGIKRTVLSRVAGYDPELGPGPRSVGFCEDTFFGRQLSEAGCRIHFVPEAIAVHHLDAARLQRRAWLEDAGRRGRTEAYLRYHWEHEDIRFARSKWLYYSLKLILRRTFATLPPLDGEGCPRWEMSYVTSQAMCRHFLVEQRRPRSYDRHGLVKKAQGAGPAPLTASSALTS